MTTENITLGQAIDRIIEALESINEQVRPIALEAASAHFGIQRTSVAAPPAPSSRNVAASSTAPLPPAPEPTLGSGQIPHQMDIRTLKNQKEPSSAGEMACIVAFYLQEHAPEGERKATISTQDLEKYFKQAQYRLPKRIEQVLVNAKSSGYFDTPSRGEYRLNAVGYNLVAHSLPRKKVD